MDSVNDPALEQASGDDSVSEPTANNVILSRNKAVIARGVACSCRQVKDAILFTPVIHTNMVYKCSRNHMKKKSRSEADVTQTEFSKQVGKQR